MGTSHHNLTAQSRSSVSKLAFVSNTYQSYRMWQWRATWNHRSRSVASRECSCKPGETNCRWEKCLCRRSTRSASAIVRETFSSGRGSWSRRDWDNPTIARTHRARAANEIERTDRANRDEETLEREETFFSWNQGQCLDTHSGCRVPRPPTCVRDHTSLLVLPGSKHNSSLERCEASGEQHRWPVQSESKWSLGQSIRHANRARHSGCSRDLNPSDGRK